MKTKLQNKLKSELSEASIKNNLFFDKNISSQTWFGVGGMVEVLFVPQSSEDLGKVLKNQ